MVAHKVAGAPVDFAALRDELAVPGDFASVVLADAARAAVEVELPDEDATDIPLVTVDPADPNRLVEGHVVLDPARQGWCWGRAGRAASVGTRMPVMADGAEWLGAALDLAAGGRVVAIDYASTSPQLAQRPWTEWVRTYARHGRAGHPLDEPGTADITCEVAVDPL